MTSIGSINGVFGATPVGGATNDARTAALGTIGEIGHRVLAWVGATGGGGDRAAWSADTGSASDFRPDMRELSRGGDVYGLGELERGLSAQFGATPAEEGALRRSLEDFTREAVVQVAGLSGAGPDRQLSGLRDALSTAADATAAGGIDGVSARLDAATSVLAAQNGA